MKKLLRPIARQLSRACPTCRARRFQRTSYAQHGEDLVLVDLLEGKRNGFFVDVGAHHPKRFSNTYLLYEMGWTGINIDPTPGLADLFREQRPLDTFLELGIAGSPGELTFHLYDEPAYNTFNEPSHELFLRRGFPKPIGEIKVKTLPLAAVLEAHVPAGKAIDLFSIDAEGLDFAALQSNDWKKFRPRLVCLESGTTIQSVLESPSHRLLTEQGYELVSHTVLSSFYVSKA